MFRDDYKKELDKLTLSDEFIQQTIDLLEKQSAGTSSVAEKNIVFSNRPMKKTAVAAAVLILSAAVAAGAYFTDSFSLNTTEDAAPPAEIQNEKNDFFDSAVQHAPKAEHSTEYITYTIADAEFASAAATTGREQHKEKTITYNTQNTGGMGYEGYNCYSVAELEHNPTYTVGDEFDTLPVYRFTPLSPRDAVKNIEKVLDSIEIPLPDLKITWSRPLYMDGVHYTNSETVTSDTVSPGDEYNLNYIDGDITNIYGDSGEFSLWATRGKMRISFDSNLSDADNTADIFAGVAGKYPGLVNYENSSEYSWHDYTYKGDINRNLYSYQSGKDYGENLFNATMNNISISQVKNLEEDIAPTKTFFWVSLPYYTRAADLPAINYRQALGYLFSGQFYSSYTDKISNDAEIVHIDMTYLPPEYKMDIPGYDGYSVPFYKFYVQTPDSERTTPAGIMKEYHVYYVCAIHPSYIQLDDSYYRFN